MSNEAITWAWSIEGLKPVERLILIAVADYADENWSSFPGQALLAKRACCGERTVREKLKDLEERGLFRRERRYVEGMRTSDRFVLNQRYRQNLPVDGHRQNKPTLPAENSDLTGSLLPGNPYNPQNHQIPPIVPPNIEELFTEFYRVYPRKAGKQAALRAFKQAVKKVSTPQEIILGATRFAQDPNLPSDRQYIPHPATWLNGGRWEDEPLPTREQSRGSAGGFSSAAAADAHFAAQESNWAQGEIQVDQEPVS